MLLLAVARVRRAAAWAPAPTLARMRLALAMGLGLIAVSWGLAGTLLAGPALGLLLVVVLEAIGRAGAG